MVATVFSLFVLVDRWTSRTPNSSVIKRAVRRVQAHEIVSLGTRTQQRLIRNADALFPHKTPLRSSVAHTIKTKLETNLGKRKVNASFLNEGNESHREKRSGEVKRALRGGGEGEGWRSVGVSFF